MSIGSESDPPALENLSALADGELDSNAVARACNAWRNDPTARATWHAYQLIGDVLRSDNLAVHPHRDAALLARLRERLACEPTVLAPEPSPEPSPEPAMPLQQPAPQVANSRHSARWSWIAPSAVAAGFVLVAGALMVTRAPLPGAGPAETLAGATPFNAAGPQVVSAPALTASETAFEPAAQRVTGTVIRDSRLDRYLAAHQQFAGTTALGVPSSFLRNAAAEVPGR